MCANLKGFVFYCLFPHKIDTGCRETPASILYLPTNEMKHTDTLKGDG